MFEIGTEVYIISKNKKGKIVNTFFSGKSNLNYQVQYGEEIRYFSKDDLSLKNHTKNTEDRVNDLFYGSIVEINGEYYYSNGRLGISAWDLGNIILTNIHTGKRSILQNKETIAGGGTTEIKFIAANLFKFRTKFTTDFFGETIEHYITRYSGEGVITIIDMKYFDSVERTIKDFIKDFCDGKIKIDGIENEIVAKRVSIIFEPKYQKLDIKDWDYFKAYCTTESDDIVDRLMAGIMTTY